MILDFIHNFVQAISVWFFDVGLPLPCWDLIAESLGVCR